MGLHLDCFQAMALGLSLSSDIWRFFIENVDAGEEYSMSFDSLLEWELIWLKQVACLPTEGLNLSDPYNPVVQFSLRCEEYWITIRPGYAFPHQSPIVKCAYQQGFYFDWCSKDECSVQVTTLTNVVQWYRDYCESIDAAILQIKSADNNFFTLLEYSMHNEDPECFAVKLCPKFAVGETITIHVDWRNPLDFPRFISSTNEQRFSNLNCDIWDVNENLFINLQRIVEE